MRESEQDPAVTLTLAWAELAPSAAQSFEASVPGLTGGAIVWTVEQGILELTLARFSMMARHRRPEHVNLPAVFGW